MSQSHGCGEEGDPAALAACVGEVAAACAGGSAPPECAAPLTQAVTEAADGLPPDGEDPPACEGTEPQEQLACAVRQVREQCTDDTACEPLDLVQTCLEGDEDCAPPDVLAAAAVTVCGAVEAESDEEEEPGEEPTCEDDLATCDTAPSGPDCEKAMEYLQDRVREIACEPAADACAVVAQVEALLACTPAQACAFRAVWDGAIPTICQVVGGEECATTLDECDDPTADPDCADATAYLQGRAQDAPCESADPVCTIEDVVDDCSAGVARTCADAVESAVVNAVCAGRPDCPPEPVASLRGCLVWGENGTPGVADGCVQEAVIDAICAAQPGDCLLEHPAIAELIEAGDACTGQAPEQEDPPTCQGSLQDVLVAALCADKAACFPKWAEEAETCKGADDLGCHALGLLHEACRRVTCPPDLKAFEPCVRDVAAQRCGDKDLPTFLRGWIVEQCVARGGTGSACPTAVQVTEPRALASPPDSAPVREPTMFQNGSTTFPFRTLTAAMTVLRQPRDYDFALKGPINIGGGDYVEPGVIVVGSDEADEVIWRIQPSGTPTVRAALHLSAGHPLWITGPIRFQGSPAIDGPSSSAELTTMSDRVYVDDWSSVAASFGNETTAIPELTAVRLRVEGAGPETVLQKANGGAWEDVVIPSSGVVEIAEPEPALPAGAADGLFQGTMSLRLKSTAAASLRLSLELAGVQTQHVYATDSATVDVVVPQAPPTPPPSVPRTPETELPPAVRIAGEDRSATAAAVSRASFPDGAEQVFVATGQSFADALAAGPAASRAGSPVVLVERDRIPQSTGTEIERLQPRAVRLMGGTAAISEEVEAQLAAMGLEVSRLRGGDRYATAAAVSAAHFSPDVAVAYVAGGEGFADALSGGAAAAALGGPVLLVQRDELPTSTAEELRRLRPGRVVVLGGRQAVSDEVAARLREIAGEVRRVSGVTRYATSAAVSRDTFGVTGGTVYVATGQTFPDALAGVPAAGADRAPLMLVEPDRLPPEIAAELDRLRPKRIVILGGERSVTQRLERELRSYQEP